MNGDVVKIEYNEREYIVSISYSEKYAQFIINSSEVLFDAEPLGDYDREKLEIIGKLYGGIVIY